MKLASVQPFSLTGAGGGPRILRSMLEDAPADVFSVCTAPRCETSPRTVREIHLPARRQFGRLESTRAVNYLGALEVVGRHGFKRRLARLLRDEGATAVHAVAHGVDMGPVHSVARELDVPFFLSVHDDPAYVLRDRPEAGIASGELGGAWRGADRCFVISPEMGEEMSRRFGDREFVLVTDGLRTVADRPRDRSGARLTAYFMGAIHLSYAENLEALAAGMACWQKRSGLQMRIVMRSGRLPEADMDPSVSIEVREWADQEAIEADLAEASFVYLPLPFGEEHESFVRFSLSTKLVTYLGSGLPVLFHGPRESAACELLAREDGAVIADSLDPDRIADSINEIGERGDAVTSSALDIARRQFLLDDIRSRFWNATGVATSRELASPAEPI